MAILKRAIKEKTMSLKAAFSCCKKYHEGLIGQHISLKDGMLYKLNEPKVTRIRELQQKVVPLALPYE